MDHMLVNNKYKKQLNTIKIHRKIKIPETIISKLTIKEQAPQYTIL